MTLLGGSLGASAQTTYYWRGSASNRWNDAGNWNTQTGGGGSTRTNPATNDVLVFDGTINANFPSPLIVTYGNGGNAAFSETIGRMRVVNGANIVIAGPTNGNDGSIINVAGGTASPNADDFFVEGGSSITFAASGQTANRFLHIKIGTGKKGLVTGNIAFDCGNVSRLLATDAAGLTFSGSGSTTTVANLTGNPFGTTGANTVVGSSGSQLADFSDVVPAGSVRYVNGANFKQRSGIAPFGTGTTAVTTFASGTKYIYYSGTFSDVGQTYGNLEFAGTVTTTVAGSQRLTIANDLTATSGTANLNVTGTGATGGVFIGGDLKAFGGVLNFVPATASELTVLGSALLTSNVSYTPTVSGNVLLNDAVIVTSSGALTFNGAASNVKFGANVSNDGALSFSQGAASTVTFAGTSAQAIQGSASMAFGNNTLFEINNTAGLTVGRAFTVRRGLVLTAGLIYTDRAAGTLLTLASGATVTGGSNASHVSGYLARQAPATVVAGAPLSLLYPVGKNNIYRPFTLNVNTQNSSSTVNYIGEIMDTAPAQVVSAPLDHVSFKRYVRLAPDVALGSFSGTVTLSFAADDFVTDPALASFVMAKSDAPTGPWSSIGRSANSGSASNGSLTSASFITFGTNSNFSLASTVASVGFPGTNPLPVQLTRFAASTKGNGIALDWATAMEKNSAYFEVQRSTDSETFRAIEKVQALGTSTTTHTYTTLDRAPLAGLNYYRLRQVDADGKESYSSVVSARWSAVAAVELYPNPSSDKVYLNGLDGTVRFRVLNEMGKTLMTGETTGAAGVSVQALPAGMYLLELVTEGGRTVQRFARQ
ncbi:T9SS type A sorting domain-containing protein [Hymenobacter sp. 5317J-9]|uniref:T9SS type A sorting domain-containing protein n=1 Tax=Hymenobacter sp. 5317J-9 TaxID=2932250 RepID=UPI001FD69AB2|nr:T9SS type A sorting domain-containing protein [Hymenobacter sp. 5317J-9]UOQ99394.1 T9SS type A sorting domain-containing protein [Hymenobacter sp. 5317J-9]